MKLTMLGTGNSAMMPVYGCSCEACLLASSNRQLKREKTSAYIEHNGHILLLDANAPDLLIRFPAGKISAILVTHYHMDHVHSLFDLRWGMGEPIPVISPDDPNGCDDLYKHSGLLDFSQRATPFQAFTWQGITVTPLPLTHSKLCLGYAFELNGQCLAYLTDTNGLPVETKAWLLARHVQWIITDCNYPPIECEETRLVQNHNDIHQVVQIVEECQPDNLGLVHVSHDTINWLNHHQHTLPHTIQLLSDGQEITL
ncbi:phosphonate metabolism protein PhnP [Vibrio nomapromontoriensis]|uniref:phosphonate metabolism protein PhnP n=1 Tax=Vibrio nomapromontoriensis TaxID=2910246 RepID=UPI003D0EE36F